MGDVDAETLAALLLPIEKVAHFIATGDDDDLTAFANKHVVIVENFEPYLFEGPRVVRLWAQAMRAHVSGIEGLQHRFGSPHDVSVAGETAYLSMPTHWSGMRDGQRFDEDGGWAFVLVKHKFKLHDEWRVRSYSWAVTQFSLTSD